MSIGSKVRQHREQLGLSQLALAEATQLSLRTVQRIESNATQPRGHSLSALARVFEIEIGDLLEPSNELSKENTSAIKTINASILAVIVVPFGNLIFPIYFWQKYRSIEVVDLAGRAIVNFQILWSLITYTLLAAVPFLVVRLELRLSPVLIVWALAVLLNLWMVFRMSKRLNRGDVSIYKIGLKLL